MEDKTFPGPTNFCSVWSLPGCQCDPSQWPGTGHSWKGPDVPGKSWHPKLVSELQFQCAKPRFDNPQPIKAATMCGARPGAEQEISVGCGGRVQLLGTAAVPRPRECPGPPQGEASSSHSYFTCLHSAEPLAQRFQLP